MDPSNSEDAESRVSHTEPTVQNGYKLGSLDSLEAFEKELGLSKELGSQTTPNGVSPTGHTARPPDGGWGWVVVAACMLGHILMVGTARSFGIFYVALMEKFEITNAQAAWVPSLFNSVRMLMGPLVSWLCDRYTCRLVVMVGGVVFALSCVASAFATSIVYLTISFGVIASLGAGCIYTPMYIILSKYFDRNKGKAMSLATLGSGVGTLIIALLVSFLLTEFSYTGAMLIIGGLEFHNVMIGLLFRPLPTAKPRTSFIELQKQKNLKEDVEIQNSMFKNFLTSLKERLSLLANVTFVLFGLSIMSMSFCLMMPLTFLPPLCKEYGMTDHRTKAAFLVSTMSFADMSGRFVWGFVFDLRWVRSRRPLLFCALGLVMGLSVGLLPFVGGFWSMFGVCIVWGFVEAGFHSQRVTILTSFLPIQHVPNAVGFLIFFQGLGNFLSILFGGLMADALETYHYSFVFGACVMVFFVALFLVKYSTELCRRKKTGSQP